MDPNASATNGDSGIPDEPDSGDNGAVNSGENASGNETGPADPAATPRRKRGRPSKAEIAARGSAGPADLPEAREKGQSKTGSSRAALDVSTLSAQLEGLHKMAALVLKNPTVEISTQEATKLAQALTNLAKHYDFKPNPAVMAWVQVGAVSSAIYGPRIALAVAARKAQQANTPKAEPVAAFVTPAQPGQMRFQ